MKRRGFFGALAGLVAAPAAIAVAKEVEAVAPVAEAAAPASVRVEKYIEGGDIFCTAIMCSSVAPFASMEFGSDDWERDD